MAPDHISMEQYIEVIVSRIEESNKRILAEHVAQCPLHDRIRRVELRFAALLGWMGGSGILGGFGGAIITKLIA